MIVEVNSFIPLATILGAAAAPTIAAIWAEGKRSNDARRAADKADIAAMRVAEVKSATMIAAEKVSEVKKTLTVTAQASSDKLDQIHALVNSQLTEAIKRFEEALKEVEVLKAEVIKLHEERQAR